MNMTYLALVKKQIYPGLVISVMSIVVYKISSFFGPENPAAKNGSLLWGLAGAAIAYLFILPLIDWFSDE